MPTTNLVLLCGSTRCGKSTVANLLRKHWAAQGAASYEAPLALLVKQELSQLLGVPVLDQEARRASWRRLWQFWGTEARRMVSGEYYWLHKWEQDAKRLVGHIIVPDVRFVNEVGFMDQFAKQRGMIPRFVYVRRGWWWEIAQRFHRHHWHRSEREWRALARQFPYAIYNNAGLPALEKQVQRLVERW